MRYWDKESRGFYEKQNEINNRYEISDERWQELLDGQSKGFEIYTKENGTPDLRSHAITEKEIIENLRARRDIECYPIINRGQLWYDTLNEQQKNELRIWYKLWLDVTKTKVIPTKLSWLN